jgi:putative membrane protein
MKLLSIVLIAFVALLHSGFLVLEMFYWDHDIGRKVFGMTPELSKGSAVLAMNQGLYNGFLVAGLVWGLLQDRFDVKRFFLGCVIVAGIFGAATAKPSIFYTQAMPAILALIALYMSRSKDSR